MATQTHWKKNYNYAYMGAYSLTAGQDMVLTIKETKTEMVKNQKGENEQCFTCYFHETPKPMILNKTNCKAIEKVLGSPFIEDWAGQKIQLYSANVKAFGTETDCLRIRDFKPQGEAIDTAPAIKRLEESKDLKELKATYNTLNKALQGHADVIKAKDDMKTKLGG